jgi:plastocyanin
MRNPMKSVHLFALAVLGAAFPALAADLSVTQQNQTFSAPSMSVHVGDKLSFNNQDDVTHNITVKGGADGDAEDLGLQKPGKSVAYTFEAKGSYRIICSIHPKMKMTVNVQ